MASVGVSLQPPEPGTSPVASNSVRFRHGSERRFDSFARSTSTVDGALGGRQEASAVAAAASQRLMRKRSYSCCHEWRGAKRRRKGIVPPTRFLLGGNICDPLNLGGMGEQEDNSATPVTSPMPTPKHKKERIEVIIPPNICDPLGLDGPEEAEQALISPSAQRKKRHRKKRKHPSGHGAAAAAGSASASVGAPAGEGRPAARSVSESGDSVSQTTADEAEFTATAIATADTPIPSAANVSEPSLAPAGKQPSTPAPATPAVGTTSSKATLELATPSPAGPPPVSPGTPQQPRQPGRPHSRKSAEHEIVSPVIPQPGARPVFTRASAGAGGGGAGADSAPVKFNKRDAAFQYGNYNRYYGYRNGTQSDPRLATLKKEWFVGRDVLDVGCNIGHITLTIARDYLPRRCVGLDIDASLIKIARKNVKHYQRSGDFPASMSQLYGDLVPPHKAPGTSFPRNVSFVHANYVLECDELLETVRPEFDVILCLSITKWVHLNFGDAGIRRFFRRAFLNLRPGGRLILEPQPWASYVKKKKLTPRIWENFQQIRLRPETFPDLLISEVGFNRYVAVGRPHHNAKGFNRQIQVFIKAGETETAPTEEEGGEAITSATSPDPPTGETDSPEPQSRLSRDVTMATEPCAGDAQQQSDVSGSPQDVAMTTASRGDRTETTAVNSDSPAADRTREQSSEETRGLPGRSPEGGDAAGDVTQTAANR